VVYLPSEVRTEFPLTAYELVQLGRSRSRLSLLGELSLEDRDKIRAAMEMTGCWDFRARDYHTLSGGERQLVCFARGIAQDARVLLLDESFSRLDLHHQSRVGELLAVLGAKGYSFVLVSHDLAFVLEYSTSCLIWPASGPLTQGPVKETLTEGRLRDLYPGAQVFLGQNPRTGAPKIFFDRASD
jgi:iron complex transport system ATP-binding protein